MISNFGNWLLISSLILNSAILLSCNYSAHQKKIFHLNTIAIVAAFSLLIIGFIASDFSIQNVFLHSGSITPVSFRIAAAWASHEGSILLWSSLLSLVNSSGLMRVPKNFTKLYAFIAAYIQLLFVAYIYFTSNPFQLIAFKPSEGLGLNPMLQDIALIIHPPILYFGNVCYVACFIMAGINLTNFKNYAQLRLISQKFATIGLIFLSIGVGLGSWWAYRELGWGGFWFFDPIENVSLLPWLSGIALHHCFLINDIERQQKWMNIFSIITFLSTVAGTCLVRSGLLNSVHSFAASPERAMFLAAVFILIATPALLMLFLRNSNSSSANNSKIELPKRSIKETGLIISNITWLISFVVLFASIIYPLIYLIMLEIEISLTADFFLKLFIPFILVNVLLLAVIPNFNSFRKLLMTFVASSLITAIIAYYSYLNSLSVIAVYLSIVVILINCMVFIEKSYGETSRISAKTFAAILSHIGFGLLVLSIAVNCATRKEIEFIGAEGETIESEGFSITLKNVKFSEQSNYYRQIVEFWVSDLHRNITIIAPENRLYKIEGLLSQESDIFSYLFYDIYGVLSQIDGEIISARIYYQPFISFIWLSVMLIANGLLISFLAARKNAS